MTARTMPPNPKMSKSYLWELVTTSGYVTGRLQKERRCSSADLGRDAPGVGLICNPQGP